jgi:hypothetical protein
MCPGGVEGAGGQRLHTALRDGAARHGDLAVTGEDLAWHSIYIFIYIWRYIYIWIGVKINEELNICLKITTLVIFFGVSLNPPKANVERKRRKFVRQLDTSLRKWTQMGETYMKWSGMPQNDLGTPPKLNGLRNHLYPLVIYHSYGKS